MSGIPAGENARRIRDNQVRTVVIVGGGTAGWMAAAGLHVATRHLGCRIVLVESEEIGTVGVGESTLPGMRRFNRILGINENEFVRNTHATFKLAIKFVDWWRIGHSYFNPLEAQGFSSQEEESPKVALPPVYQYLLKLAVDSGDPDMDQYSLCCMAAQQNRFDRPANLPEASFSYAFQFDASLYAKYLRSWSEQRGVQRVEGRIVDVQLNGANGFIDAVALQSGERIEGDLFIDCSGFRSLLLGGALKIPYIDWSHWLPCDRAWAVPCESAGPLMPYTRATAREAGWQWRIPLQHRTGNGYVFSSKFTTEERARELLLANLEGRPLAEPRLLKFTAGRRTQAWAKNCIALGLASGFVEPLESTSIQFIQNYLESLIRQFPDRDCNPLISDDFNRTMVPLDEAVRDFIILHYKATEREDTGFWRYCKYMSVPETLTATIGMFRSCGRFSAAGSPAFAPRQWLAVMYNQGIVPESYPPLVLKRDDKTMRVELAKIRAGIKRTVDEMPSLDAFIATNCSIAENLRQRTA